MIPKTLEEIANYIVSDGKGILAADESSGTIEKRFKSINVESTEDNRRKYREMLFRSPVMAEAIGGVILFDETLRQKSSDGDYLRNVILDHGSLPGIKVDQGVKEFEGGSDEKITTGLDGLHERCQEYEKLGAKFTKWRAVINVSDEIPSNNCINENMNALAEYALIAQQNNMVPIVEPEVIMDGSHSVERCHEVTNQTLLVLFEMLDKKMSILKELFLNQIWLYQEQKITTKPPLKKLQKKHFNVSNHLFQMNYLELFFYLVVSQT